MKGIYNLTMYNVQCLSGFSIGDWLRRSSYVRIVMLIAIFNCQFSIVNSVKAQQENTAFYIYQNDGHFDGFFYDEVEKISYSFLDTLGIEHDDIVSQEIVTADSTYRIMLSAIDSVGFVQPEMKFQPNVRNVRKEGMLNYMGNHFVDNMQLVFYQSTPDMYLPRVGDVLIDFDPEEGFSGRVTSIDSNSGPYYLVTYEPLESIKDVFQRFVGVEQIDHDRNGNMVRRRVAGAPELRVGEWDDAPASKAPRRASDVFEGNVFSFSFSGHLPIYVSGDFTASLDANLAVETSIKGSYNIPVIGAYYIGLTFQQDVKMGLGVTLDGKIGGLKERQTPFKASVPIPATAPIFELRSIPGLFLRGESHLKFSADIVKNARRVWFKLEFNDDWLPTFNFGNAQLPELDQPISDPWERDASLEFNGFIQAGLHAPLELGVNKWLSSIIDASFGTHVYIGPKLSGTLKFSLSDAIKDQFSFYNYYKDTSLSLSPLSLDFETKAELSTLFSGKQEVTIADGSVDMISPIELYLLPEFKLEASGRENDQDVGGEITTKLTPSRNIIFSSDIGTAVYKGNKMIDKKLATDFREDGYYPFTAYSQYSKVWNERKEFDWTFRGLYPGNYTVRPYIRLMGMDFPASPAVRVRVPGNYLELERDTIVTNCDGEWVAVKGQGQYDSIRIVGEDLRLKEYIVPAKADGGNLEMRFNMKPWYGLDSLYSYISLDDITSPGSSTGLMIMQTPNNHFLPKDIGFYFKGDDGNNHSMGLMDGDDDLTERYLSSSFNGDILHVVYTERRESPQKYEDYSWTNTIEKHVEFDVVNDKAHKYKYCYTLRNGSFYYINKGKTDGKYPYERNMSGTFDGNRMEVSKDNEGRGESMSVGDDENHRTGISSVTMSYYDDNPRWSSSWSGSNNFLQELNLTLYFE